MIPLVAAGIGSAIGLGESIFGGIKANRANKAMDQLEKNKPIYSRPDEIKQYLEQAKTNANSKMPGQTQMEQNAQQSTQSMMTKLEDSGQLDAGSIQKLYQSEVGAYNNLAMQQAQYYQSNQDRLSQAFNESAKYADQEFEYNINAPWQRQYNRQIGNYEAGQKMVGQGLNTLASSAMNYAGMKSGSSQNDSSQTFPGNSMDSSMNIRQYKNHV